MKKTLNNILTLKILMEIFIITCFIPSLVFAARPLSTEDAGVVESAGYEIEVGYDFLRDADKSEFSGIGISLKHGITEKFDMHVAVPYDINPDDGIGNVEVGLKFSLFSIGSSAVSFVFANQPGEAKYTAIGVLSQEMGNLVMHLNLGYVVPGSENESGFALYAVAVESTLGKKTILGVEITGKAGANDTGGPVETMLGINRQVSDEMSIDFGIGTGLNEEGPKIKFASGLTYGF